MSKILTFEEIKKTKQKRFTLLQNGDSGAGKTTRALTATQFGPVLIRDYDGKVEAALRHFPEELSLVKENIFVQPMSELTVEDIIEETQKLVKQKATLPYATIVEDTYTLMNNLMYSALKERYSGFDLYGRLKDAIIDIYDALWKLPCNLIVNCHPQVVEVEDAGSTQGKTTGVQGNGRAFESLFRRFSDQQFIKRTDTKNIVVLKNSATYSVNTSVDPKWINPKGYATTFGLEIFESVAYKKENNTKGNK